MTAVKCKYRLCLFAVLLFCTSVMATTSHEQTSSHTPHHATNTEGSLRITDAYVRGLPPGQTTTAAFFTIENTGKTSLLLEKISSPIADSVEIHESKNINGQMQMRKLDGVTIKAGEAISFKPNAKHIMLSGLTKPLKEGDEISLRLCFGDFCHMLALPVVSVLNEHTQHHH